MSMIKKNIKEISSYQSQQGFTLVELIISLILGLIVGAAALQILLTSSRNQATQDAASQIQDDGTFGLQMMRRQIMLANLGAREFKATDTADKFTSQYTVNDRTRQSGVVLTAPELDSDGKAEDNSNLARLRVGSEVIPVSILSQDGSASDLPANQKLSNLQDINSDQLTIQYQAPYDMTNCEGKSINAGQYAIERYFIRLDGRDNALACNAIIYNLPANDDDVDISTYMLGGETKTNNITGNGTVILPRVDSFQVQLGITDSADFATAPQNFDVRYVNIEQYRDLPEPKPRIISIKTAILVRSLNTPGAGPTADESKFNLLDQTNKSLKAGSKNELRNIYTNTILIRNGRGNS